jgi:hypothetical protein
MQHQDHAAEARRILLMSHVIYNVVILQMEMPELLTLELGEALFPLHDIVFRALPVRKRTLSVLAAHGALKRMKMAILGASMSVDHKVVLDAFAESCRYGHLAVTRWLVETFHLTTDDARAHDNFALRRSCENGHLEVARWLVETFHLTADDARADNNYALRWSCGNGHLDVARWLVDRFYATPTDRSKAFIRLHHLADCSPGV